MDKEKTRELKRTAAGTTGRVSLARRQQKLSSVQPSHNNGKRHHLSVSGNDDGGRELMMDGSWKKEKVRGSRGSSSNEDGSGGSDGGDDEEVRAPPAAAITTNINSKKRVRINEKISDDYVAVDPAVVPRKLRSAIHKRSNALASPPVPDAKKRPHYVHNGVIIGMTRHKQNMVNDPLTKDEEEVVETLFALASMVADTKPLNNGSRKPSSNEGADPKAMASASLSEAQKVEDTKFPFKLPGMESANTLSHLVESSEEAKGGKPVMGVLDQHKTVTSSGIQKVNLELNSTPIEDIQGSATFLTSPHALPINGLPQHTQLEVSPLNPEIRMLPVSCASVMMRQEVKSLNETRQNNSHSRVVCLEEATLDMQNVLSTSTANGNLTRSCSVKPTVVRDSACFAARASPTGNDLSVEKPLLVSAGRRSSWKKCSTHVYISHLIRNYQNTENKHHWPIPSNELKLKEAMKLAVVAENEPIRLKNGQNSLSCTESISCITESKLEARIGIRNDGWPQPEQKPSTSSGIYSQQNSTCDFLSLSAGGESGKHGKRIEPSGKHPISYVHPMPPHHPMMPFSLPPGHYSSPYPEQLAAQQLQLPHYISNPFYGVHVGHAGRSTTQQQQQRQQMWQAHLNHYRSPPIMPRWQNGRPHDPSLVPFAQMQSVLPPSPSTDTHSGAGHHHSNPPLQHKGLPVPLPNSSGKRHHHQQPHHNHPGSYNEGGMLRPEGAAQLQLLCNAQHM